MDVHHQIDNWNQRIVGLTDLFSYSLTWQQRSQSYSATLKLGGPSKPDNTWEFILDDVGEFHVSGFDGYLFQMMQLRFEEVGKKRFCLCDKAAADDMPHSKLYITFSYLIDLN